MYKVEVWSIIDPKLTAMTPPDIEYEVDNVENESNFYVRTCISAIQKNGWDWAQILDEHEPNFYNVTVVDS